MFGDLSQETIVQGIYCDVVVLYDPERGDEGYSSQENSQFGFPAVLPLFDFDEPVPFLLPVTNKGQIRSSADQLPTSKHSAASI